jgi:hypothetical protein
MNFNVAEGMLGADSFAGVYQMLSTDIGQKKLRQYRDRMIEAEKVLRRTQDAAAQAG